LLILAVLLKITDILATFGDEDVDVVDLWETLLDMTMTSICKYRRKERSMVFVSTIDVKCRSHHYSDVSLSSSPPPKGSR
jgi:hypothetical protein